MSTRTGIPEEKQKPESKCSQSCHIKSGKMSIDIVRESDGLSVQYKNLGGIMPYVDKKWTDLTNFFGFSSKKK